VTFTVGQLLGNDTDPDHDPLVVTGVDNPVNGTVTLVNGVVTFTPDANYNGPASFTYTIDDGHGGTDTATVNINVTPVNDPPDAVDDSGSTPEDTPVTFTVGDLLGNDTDPENDTLTVTGVSNPSHGTVTLVNGVVTFTPDANYNGPASFNYSISDGHGGTDTATVNINVVPVNDPPDTDNVSASGAEDSPGIPVALHGSDVDGTVASFQINSLPANGTLMFNGAPVTVGQVIPAVANGAGVTFVPNANWNGVTDFNYTATDNQGAPDPTPGVATITVTDVNDGPDTGNSSATGVKGAVNIGLTMTGTDPDGTVVSFTIKSLPGNGTLSDGQGHNYAVGDVVTAVNGKADIFFTPSATFTGTVNFNYASNDDDGAQDATPGVGTVVITPPISAPDPKPPETNNTSASGNEDVVKLPISLTGTDSDGTVKSFVINDLPANGKLYDANGVQLTAGAVVTATGNAATVYFTPNANWNGDTTFHYSSRDNDGLTDATPATAKIHINDVNDGPDTCDVSVCASSCADYVKVGLAGSDSDGKVVSFVITSIPTDGVLKYGSTVLKVGDTVPANAYGQASVTFYPNSNWDGVTTFKYASKDDDGAVDSTPATATIKVAHANDGPETQNVTVTGVEDGGPVTLKITGTDTDGTVTAFKIDSLPTGGVLKFGTQVLKVGDVITATSGGATLTFTPNADWNGSTTFQYQAKDNDGAYDSTPATGKITITGQNDGPSTKDVSASGCEDGGKIAICLAGTDPDGKVASFTITDLPANGILTDSTGKVLTAGAVVTATNNGATVYFTPNANWSGGTSFHYAAKDDLGAADATPNTATITVTGVNDAPTTNNTEATGTEDQTTGVKITLSGADIDGTVTAFKITSLPANGTFKDANGVVLSVGSLVTATAGQAFVYFTPKANFSGDTTFQYAAKDNGGAYDGSPATGTIHITGVNDGPDAVNDTTSVTAGQSVKLASTSLLSNDTDPDGDKLTITSVQAATHGTVALAADGSVTFTAASGYAGAASFTYTISDGHGGVDTATVNVDVKAPSSPSGPTGIGVHTQGFWANNGAVYWDGQADASGVKHSPAYPTFPKAELTYNVDTNCDGTADSNKYLLIGDFNKNGVTDNGEHTFLISLSDAKALLTTSAAGDARLILGRDLVTAWLNYLSDNPMGTTANSASPAWFVQEAVDWLSQVSGTTKTLAHGIQNTGGLSGGDFVGTDISTSGGYWNTGINLDGVSGISTSGKDVDAGAHLHTILDTFNNTGMVGSTLWANDAD
ncbi:MAG TPA: Ig-like domain-containing protein, partial [Phenylobacterium sp.]